MTVAKYSRENSVVGKLFKAGRGVYLQRKQPQSGHNNFIYGVNVGDKLRILTTQYTTVFSLSANNPLYTIDWIATSATSGIMVVGSSPEAENAADVKTYLITEDSITFQSTISNAVPIGFTRGGDIHSNENWLILTASFGNGVFIYEKTNNTPIEWTWRSFIAVQNATSGTKFSPDGNYLALVGNILTNELCRIYSFDSVTGATALISTFSFPSNAQPRTVEWINDNYLVVSFQGVNGVQMYGLYFDGSTISAVYTTGGENQLTQSSSSLAVHKNKNFIVSSKETGGTGDFLACYSFDGSNFALISGSVDVQPATEVYTVVWVQDDLLAVGTASSGMYLYRKSGNTLTLVSNDVTESGVFGIGKIF